MYTRTSRFALVLLLVLGGCSEDAGPGETTDTADATDSTADTGVVQDTGATQDTGVAEQDADAALDADAVEDAADADVVCPADRVPRVVNGVVVDPCGCCAIDSNYCHGHRVGGSPMNGTCAVVSDDAPPCTNGVDANGCATNYCSGSCLDTPDTGSGEPDAG